jgi:hypothetical protein
MTDLAKIAGVSYQKFSHMMNYRQPFPKEIKERLNRTLGLETAIRKMNIT